MTLIEHAAAAVEANFEMLKATLADFSDADLLVRPISAANHAAWQIGHLICSETGMVNAITPGAIPELPAGFAGQFTKETSKLDDPAAFPRKSELLAIFAHQRQALALWIRSLKEVDLDQPAPERMRSFIPTVGMLVLLIPAHLSMHIGQLQVIRRKLGKPNLF